MLRVADKAAPVAEDKLDPAGRYVVAWHWGDRRPLAPGDTDDRQRVVYDADAYAEDTGRWYDTEGLAPGQLYDRTMDIAYDVAEWVAMRGEIAEAERKAATLARVERMPGMPQREHEVQAVAVTEDGTRHPFTVATRIAWCASCGQHPDDHAGYVAPPPDPLDDEWTRRQEESRLMRVKIANGHAFTAKYRIRNEVADRMYFRLAFPDNDTIPAWLEAAYRLWSPECVALAEARAAEEITRGDYDAIGAAFTRPWWEYHDNQWAGWSERRDRDARRVLAFGGFGGGFRGGFR